MASGRPEGDRDILDWLSVGRAIGSAIEQATSAVAESQPEDSNEEQKSLIIRLSAPVCRSGSGPSVD